DDGGCSCGLTSSLQAAREAEAVAATGSSGQGHVFLDGVAGEDGRPACKCNTCFGGANCSLLTPNCTADASSRRVPSSCNCWCSGNPMFLEPYWVRHGAASAVVVSGWHRMSYRTTDGMFQSIELEKQIRELHRAVGNAVVDDKHLVFGAGSTQLINVLVYALSPDADYDASPPARVVATVPYYRPYKSQTAMFDGPQYKWDGATAVWVNATRNSTKSFIEFVTSPNNPDALLHQPVLGGSAVIVDRAYYWPHFTHIPAPADEDVMLFTMSKPSGHAGSRLGWALIRNEKVAKKAYQYVQNSIMGASRDTQLRMLGIVKAILTGQPPRAEWFVATGWNGLGRSQPVKSPVSASFGNGIWSGFEPILRLTRAHGEEDIFAFGHDVMRSRWRRLNAVVSRSRRISLQKIPPQFCTYFKRIRVPSPAYAWVKCEREENQDCHEALLKANIITRSGVENEAGSRYTRVSLLKSDDDFDVLLERITDLVNEENHEAPGSNPL
ncbi:hypothetical protein EJB05_17186, partial [Eragrostis curvula]